MYVYGMLHHLHVDLAKLFILNAYPASLSTSRFLAFILLLDETSAQTSSTAPFLRLAHCTQPTDRARMLSQQMRPCAWWAPIRNKHVQCGTIAVLLCDLQI